MMAIKMLKMKVILKMKVKNIHKINKYEEANETEL
ncbi:MAG: hypothetical protein KatS3mg035_2283 [Bacteroidia bacterium]|nr:MAG: hypothetical protein KatS3mg035_2283 [Bacteroidia bacterium]